MTSLVIQALKTLGKNEVMHYEKIACLPDDDRREFFRNTADKMRLNDAIVEKDRAGFVPTLSHFLCNYLLFHHKI